MTSWAIEFWLNRTSNLQANIEEDGTKASVEVGSESLCVEGVQAGSKDDARRTAQSFANRLLNTLTYGYDEALEIVPSPYRVRSEDMIVNETVVCVETAVAYLSPQKGRLEAIPGEAAAYYRKGKVARDPFDKFRNFYLVAEYVADQIRLSKKRGKLREQPLLYQALQECFSVNPQSLVQVAKSISGFVMRPDIFDTVATLLYKRQRCELNHSKAQESKKVPFNPDDERAVRVALPLMKFVAKSLLDYEQKHL